MWERTETKQTKKILKSLLYQKIAKQIKDRIIKDIRILFETEEKKKKEKNKNIMND